MLTGVKTVLKLARNSLETWPKLEECLKFCVEFCVQCMQGLGHGCSFVASLHVTLRLRSDSGEKLNVVCAVEYNVTLVVAIRLSIARN